MFKWFKNDCCESCEVRTKVINKNNYKTKDNGDIEIEVEERSRYRFSTYKDDMVISKSSIISHTENNIVFKDYRYYYNFEFCYYPTSYSRCDNYKSIEIKENLIKFKESQIKTYKYFKEDKCWKLTNTHIVSTDKEFEKSPLEVFKEYYKSEYKLIENEEEFNEYIASTLDCNTWCRKKLYDKMKELGLGDGFINQFADLVGNNLEKYHAMIDLANEVSDKDTLMYLYTYKFGSQ